MFELDRLLICDVEFILLPVDAQFKLQMSSCARTKGEIFCPVTLGTETISHLVV
jgi:hypothetical protein